MVIVTLFLVASIAMLLNHSSTIGANTSTGELQAARADYVAEAAMQHAMWRTQNNACMGDITIPDTTLGKDSYSATVTGAASGTLYKLSADQDAWIRNDDVTKVNGTTTDQHIRFEAGNIEHALTRFDLSSLPKDAQINSAIAWFYVSTGGPGGGVHPEGPLTVHRVTADWTETGATWATKGGDFESSILATIPAQPADGVWVSFNLTAQVQAWVNGQPNHGILMASTAEGVHGKYASSEDATNPPRLEVVVGSGAASPVTIKAKGELDNGVERSLKDKTAVTYQPPNTVTLQLGTDPGADAILDSFYDARNFGGANYLQINDNGSDWQQYPLIRFDLARVPWGAAVRSARLELHLLDPDEQGTATVHQVTRSWIEGTKTGGGTADGATWFTHDGTDSWTSAGGDINTPVVAEAAIDEAATWVSWEIAPLVARWLAGEPNYGLMIKPVGALEEAKFASRENTSDVRRPRLIIEYACECGSACMAPNGSGNVLMVVDSVTNPDSEDVYKQSLIESWGYTVTMIADGEIQSAFDTGLAGNDVVYVSETIDATTLGSKLGNPAIGIVNEDGWKNDDFGFESANSSNWPVGNSITITDTSHYITVPFTSGSLPIYDADMGGLAIDNTPAPDLQSLADWGNDTGLAVLETGAMSAFGSPAAGRRVMLPFGLDALMDWSRVNNNGLLIMQRAIAWALNADAAEPVGNLLLVVGNAGSPSSGDLDRKALIESWGFAVSLIATDENQAAFDTAAALADVVYVPELGAGPMGELGAKADNLATAVITEESRKTLLLGSFSLWPFVDADAINITDNTHYITETLPIGNVQLSTAVQSMWVLKGTLAVDLHVLGQLGGTQPGLAYLEKDELRNDSTPAPARRVKLPWGYGGFDFTLLTDDGLEIMKRAIEWGAGAGPAPPAPGYLDQFNDSTCDAAIDYTGTDGAVDWSPWAWTEINELDGPCSGQIRVATDPDIDDAGSSRLRVVSQGVRVYRTVDLTGFSQPTLSFDYRLTDYPALDFMRIRVFDGVGYTEIDRFTGPFDQTEYQSASYSLSAFAGLEIQVQFEFNGVSTTRTSYIDNVHIQEAGGGGPTTCIFRDDFENQSYGNQDGNALWAGDWQEVNDGGSPTGGDIRTEGGGSPGDSLRIQDDDRPITRAADLSGHTTATLTLDYKRVSLENGEYVAVSVYDGSTWTELAQFGNPPVGNDSDYQPYSEDISGFISPNFQIQLASPDGGMGNSDDVKFDNLQIEATGGTTCP